MAETQRLGATKNIMYRKFYFFIIMVFVACCLNDFSFDIPCLSFTLALNLQRSNGSYKRIIYSTKCTRFFSFENAQFTRLFVYSVLYIVLSRSGYFAFFFAVVISNQIQGQPPKHRP